MSTTSQKVEWWLLMFATVFLSFYLAVVLGGLTLGYITREIIRSNIREIEKERQLDPPPKFESRKVFGK